MGVLKELHRTEGGEVPSYCSANKAKDPENNSSEELTATKHA